MAARCCASASAPGWPPGFHQRRRPAAEHHAIGVDAEAGRVTLADGEVLEADRVVVAAGAWVTKLLPELAGRLTICRTSAVYLDPPAFLLAAWQASPVIQNVGGILSGYVLPPIDGHGLKFASGTEGTRRPPRRPRPARTASTGNGNASVHPDHRRPGTAAGPRRRGGG